MLALPPSISAGEEPKGVNLAASLNVKYCYLDSAGKEISGKAFGDLTGRQLVNGSRENENAVRTPYSILEEKSINVLFEFSRKVAPTDAAILWMWGHNEVQWFDTITVSAGDTRDSLKQFASYAHVERVKSNSAFFTIPLPKDCNHRFFLISVVMKASPDHHMFGVGQMGLYGSVEMLELLNKPRRQVISLTSLPHSPCNLFDVGQEVKLPFKAIAEKDGKAKTVSTVVNYFGEPMDQLENVFDLKEGLPREVNLALRDLPPGYYEIHTTVELCTADGSVQQATEETRFGVARLTRRSAAEALAAGCRFGINANFFAPEGLDAFAMLGLQWLRLPVAYGPNTGTRERPDWKENDALMKTCFEDRPLIPFLEVFTFPQYAYDKHRYAPLNPPDPRNTMPLEEPFKHYLSQVLRRAPKIGGVLEIWNEPWGPLSPEDYSRLAQWTREVVKREMPGTKVGPNLQLDAHMLQVAKLGGFKGMDMLTIHPYAEDFRSSPERSRLRERIHSYRNFLKANAGQELPLYVTEIGWPTPGLGAAANSATQQAQYMARSCLILYAEDVKLIIPYCIQQPETNPAEKEDFFGFVRRNLQPKPVLLAYATVAQLLEGSTFVGDLDLGKDVSALLFRRKDGTRFLAVSTDDVKKSVLIRPYSKQVEMRTIMGDSRKQAIAGNRLAVAVSGDPLYILNVGVELDSQIIARRKAELSQIVSHSSGEFRWFCSASSN
jgi:hypothetical protein